MLYDSPTFRVSPWHLHRYLAALLILLPHTVTAQVLWSDEFNSGSAPDASVWSYDLGAGGWGNSELQEYTSDSANVRIENGHLVITAREQVLKGNRRKFTSARIKTEDKLTFQYGTIEARIMVPDLADGLWPAFWTLGNNFSSVGWPDSGELDVMEMGSASAIADGVVNRRVGSAAHWEHNGGNADYGLTYDSPTDLNGSFHTLRMEWTPDLISTYIDNNWIWSIDITSASCTDCTEFHQPHFIIFNLAVGGSYTHLSSKDVLNQNNPVGDTYADKFSGVARYTHPSERFYLEYDVRINGKRKEADLGTFSALTELPAFSTHGVRGSVVLWRTTGSTHRVGLGVTNLTNALYAEFSNAGFFRPEPERSLIATYDVIGAGSAKPTQPCSFVRSCRPISTLSAM